MTASLSCRIAAGLLVVLGIAGVSAARAEVVQYGAGLRTCAEFVAAKEEQPAVEVEVLDWLAGYVSGTNLAFIRINSVLGDTNLGGAASWLGTFCRTHPTTLVAVATDVLVANSRASRARVAVELTTYGAGYKSCAVYMKAREQPSADEASFLSWLAGFVSGVNAVSLHTDDVLGDPDLSATIQWLDVYCQGNPQHQFAAAVTARLAIPDRRATQATSSR